MKKFCADQSVAAVLVTPPRMSSDELRKDRWPCNISRSVASDHRSGRQIQLLQLHIFLIQKQNLTSFTKLAEHPLWVTVP